MVQEKLHYKRQSVAYQNDQKVVEEAQPAVKHRAHRMVQPIDYSLHIC
jgi:hypothetical protein